MRPYMWLHEPCFRTVVFDVVSMSGWLGTIKSVYVCDWTDKKNLKGGSIVVDVEVLVVLDFFC